MVAVSGGVDSISLLHLLQHKNLISKGNPWKLVVAHFDHGIRADSEKDLRMVQQLAQTYGLPFVFDAGRLGKGASEEQARLARYAFLHCVRRAADAQAIITAHHQDDVIETAIVNLIRGTGRLGLSSLKSTELVIRPLLSVPKPQLIAYAQDNQLVWREDSTNGDTTYLRNHIRHNILTRFASVDRQKMLDLIELMHGLNRQIDEELINHLHLQQVRSQLDRHWFIMLPHATAREVMAHWLRSAGVREFSKKTLERLVASAKTYNPGRLADVNRERKIIIGRDFLALNNTRR